MNLHIIKEIVTTNNMTIIMTENSIVIMRDTMMKIIMVSMDMNTLKNAKKGFWVNFLISKFQINLKRKLIFSENYE